MKFPKEVDNRHPIIIWFDRLLWIILIGIIVFVLFFQCTNCVVREKEGVRTCTFENEICILQPVEKKFEGDFNGTQRWNEN